MKTIISMSATKTENQKIAELKRKKVEIVAKCKAQLAKLDIQLKALGHKPDMKLTYSKPMPKLDSPRVPGRIPTPTVKSVKVTPKSALIEKLTAAYKNVTANQLGNDTWVGKHQDAIYEHGEQLKVRLDKTPEPFRASVYAIGKAIGNEAMVNY